MIIRDNVSLGGLLFSYFAKKTEHPTCYGWMNMIKQMKKIVYM